MSVERTFYLVLLLCLVAAPFAGAFPSSPSAPVEVAPSALSDLARADAAPVALPAAPEAAPPVGPSTSIAGDTTFPPGVSPEWWAGVQADLAAEGRGTRQSPHIVLGAILTGENGGDGFGFSIAAAGDVNGDGYADVLVGAYGCFSETGRVYLYLGSTEGLSSTAAWTAGGEAVGDRFGVAVASAGDVNNDGYDDVVIGADHAAGYNGRAYVYHGSPTGLSASPDWTATGETADDYFGSAVASAGDVNGGGYADIIIGAPGYGTAWGKAYLYHGSAGGLSITPDWTAAGASDGEYYGCALASAGDVNYDGYADVLVGAYGVNGYQGAAYLYKGSAGGLSLSADWTVTGDLAGDRFGRSVASAGDVDGDGYDDVAISSWEYGIPTPGYVHLYRGSATVPSPVPDWSVYGQGAGSRLGYTVASAGDVNADGYADLLIGDGERHAFLYLGSAFGLPELPAWTALGESPSASPYMAAVGVGDVDGDGYADLLLGSYGYDDGRGRACWYRGAGAILSLDWTAAGENPGDSFAFSLAPAGDVNGDGYSDVLIGAYNYMNLVGRVYLYLGAADGLAASPDWTATGSMGESLGYALAGAGDVNGDGYADFLVGGYGYNFSQGRAYLYLGSAAGPSASPDWTATGEMMGDMFAWSVAGAGDVNGDGYADLLVGAPGYGGSQGQAYLYLGSPGGPSSSPDWTAIGEGSFDQLGQVVAGAGDVDGDGYADVLVAAPEYDYGYGRAYLYRGSPAEPWLSLEWTATGDIMGSGFGYGLAGAGDVDGDGYADVAVAAPYYNDGPGRVYLYRGSATGPSLVADWTAAGWGDEHLGGALAAAGDVNGDGYSDLLVGSEYNYGQGRAYLYLGSSTGLAADPAWTAQGVPREEGADLLGSALAAAGDVNGDGYADVLVGAYGTIDFHGRALLFQGNPAVSALDPGWTAFSEGPGDYFGTALAAAGDVNGDGYGDVLVGAWRYDNVRGKAYLYLGSAAGLSFTPDWTATGENWDDGFAYAVAGAGDVNGDGYADIIVGAWGYDLARGKVYLYLGSPTGPSLIPDWTASGENVGDDFGDALAGAGDVNGDGYADIIVGADCYNGDYGRVYLYLGSPAGPSPSVDWTATGATGGDYFGSPVAAAGDVDGDGYADVLVTAWGYLAETGRVYLYRGSPYGLAPAPAWTATGEAAGDLFGRPAASAGDVDGDGYTDVLVGAAYHNASQGKVYLYRGSPAGLSAEPTWTAVGTVTGDEFGGALAGAGDVNGDGYADVLVGAPGYGTYAGRAYLYPGSAAGLPALPAWAVSSAGQIPGLEQAFFGTASASAGDVDGDGYADILVAAPYGEPALVDLYHGNGGHGLSLLPAQWRTDEVAPIAPRGISNNATAVQLRLTGRSPAGRGQVRLLWQVAPLGTPFTATGVISGTSLDWTDTLTGGVLLTVTVDGLAPGTPYHWRVRLLYHPNSPLNQPAGRWLTMPLGGQEEKAFRTADGPITGLSAAADPWTALGSTTHLTSTADPLYVRYDWALGDGEVGQGALLTHTYAAAGFYTAVVTAANAVDAVTATVSLLVEEPLAGLQAGSNSPTSLGQPTLFTATVTAGISVTYAWSWGDGTYGAGAVVTHTFADAGLYTATVTATNVLNLLTATTAVRVEEPIAGLSLASSGPTALGEPAVFSATVVSGTGITYAWRFGDETLGPAALVDNAVVSHTYVLPGLYTATVTASNALGQAVASTTVLVEEAVTGLQVVNSGPTLLGQPTALTATVTTGTDLTCAWDLGDGSPLITAPCPLPLAPAYITHTYAAVGSYRVVVTTTNSVSELTATVVVAVVSEQEPISGLTATSNSPTIVGWPTQLEASVAAGNNVSYDWSLGDGTTASGAQVKHVYPGAGIYQAVVTATNPVNQMTATAVVSVAVALPLTPSRGGMLFFSDTQGLTTTVLVPPGAVTQTVLLAYFPLLTPTQPLPPEAHFARHAFILDIYPRYYVYIPVFWVSQPTGEQGSAPDGGRGDAVGMVPATPLLTPAPASFAFLKPVTITIYYSDEDVAGLDENTLQLFYWTGSAWADVADTCVPPSAYIRDLDGNVLSVAVCHLTEFALVGE